jgi:hypothetical protein
VTVYLCELPGVDLRLSTVFNTFNVSFNAAADIWQGRAGVYLPASAYSGVATLTRTGMGNDTRMDHQNLKLMSP